jgi:type II secretory pathway component GspD/PulD (secretin)
VTRKRVIDVVLAGIVLGLTALTTTGPAMAQGRQGGRDRRDDQGQAQNQGDEVLAPDASGPIAEKRLDLVLGEQTTISAEGVAKYSPSNDVIDVRLPKDAEEFIVVAAKPGTATLLLVMRDGRQIRYVVTVRDDTVKKRDNIRLDFYFVELNRTSNYQVGIGWPGTVQGTATAELTTDLVSGSTAGTAVVAAEALPRIDLAQEGGWAKIYRQATVIVANGEQGAFNSGGEVNVRVQGALAANLSQIKFGSAVQVQPRYDRRSGRIEVRISADISELTEPTVDNLPGRTISTLSTLVNVELGQSIVLAGADSRSSAKNSAGLPLLSQIPILGYLFGTHAGRKDHTENFILIVPTVIEAYDVSDRDLVDRAFSFYSDFEGDHGSRPVMERLTTPGRHKRRHR